MGGCTPKPYHCKGGGCARPIHFFDALFYFIFDIFCWGGGELFHARIIIVGDALWDLTVNKSGHCEQHYGSIRKSEVVSGEYHAFKVTQYSVYMYMFIDLVSIQNKLTPDRDQLPINVSVFSKVSEAANLLSLQPLHLEGEGNLMI